MGTVFEAFLAGGDLAHLEAVAATVEDEVRRLEAVLSAFDPASEVYRLNREAVARAVRVSVELWELLAACEQYRERTDGMFDITAGSDPGTGLLPTRLTLDRADRTVRYASPGVRVDLGGIGKGYALDRAGELLRRFAVENALLHGGTSSVLAVGSHPRPVDVRNPAADGVTPLGRVELAGRGLSCSAARHPGQEVSDIRDPTTCRPVAGNSACVVLAPTATGAEVLSTALLGMGRTRAITYLDRTSWPNARIAWVTESRLEWLAGDSPVRGVTP